MADDSEKVASEAPAKAVASGKAPGETAWPSEKELNSPDRKTLILLGVIFFVSFASWGSARFACNMHPPESRGAPKLATDRLITTAKDAAIEFVQRWRSHDYEGALEIVNVKNDVDGELQKAKADCQQQANECARKREAEAGRLTTAVVDKQDGFFAESTVTTTLKGTTEKYKVTLQRDNMLWKVVSKTPLN